MDDGRVPPCGRNHASWSRFPNSPMCVGRLDVEMSCQVCVPGRDGGLDGQRVDNSRCSTGPVRDTAHGSRHSGGRLVVDFMKWRDGWEPMVPPLAARSFLARSQLSMQARNQSAAAFRRYLARLPIVRGRHRHDSRIKEARAGRAEKRRYRSRRICRWSGGKAPAAG